MRTVHPSWYRWLKIQGLANRLIMVCTFTERTTHPLYISLALVGNHGTVVYQHISYTFDSIYQ